MDANTTTNARFKQPVLIGGLVMGVLSALPVVNMGNVCCCLWVVSGGLVAAYLLQQNQETPITPGDGAMVGLFAALVGAVVATAISIPISLMLAPVGRAMVQQILDNNSLPPELRQVFENMAEQRTQLGVLGSVIRFAVQFVLYVFVGGIFGTLGGLLGAVIFSKKAKPLAIP